MAELNLTPDDAMILALLRRPVKPSVDEIARVLGVVKSAAHNRLKRLEQAGYITYGRDRSMTVTEKGDGVLPELVIVVATEEGLLERAEPPLEKWD